MNIVLLSPNFPPNFQYFAIAARRAGGNVLGIGDAPYGSLSPELRHALHEYYHVESLTDYERLIRACGHLIFRHGKLDRIESHNEAWLETDARLRLDFNVPGLKLSDMAKVKRKSHMKRLFREAGLEVAEGALVNTIDEAKAFLERVGYPIVAKPDVGVGAAHTYHVTDDEAFREFWSSKSPEPYMLERYVLGRLCSFDGLTDQDGRIVFHTAHVYEPNIMEVVNDDLDVYARNFREVPEGLESAGRRAVRAFDVRERFFHIEFIAPPGEDRWLALEMNMRPPGGPMMDVMNYAHDIDLYREWANVVMYNTFTAEVRRPYFCAFVGRKRHRPHRHSHGEIMEAQGGIIVYASPLPRVFARAMGHQAYILRSPDGSELQSAIDYILTPP